MLVLAVALALFGALLLLAVPQLLEFASNSSHGAVSDDVVGYTIAGVLCLAGAFALAAFSHARYSPRR
jgi:hypothetical protein